MRLSIIGSSLFAAAIVGASTISLEARQTIQTCGDPRRATPWYRGYNPTVADHFYTANQGEFQNALRGGYKNEGVAAYVFNDNQPGTVPLYRLYSPGGTDHFYTTSAVERNNAIASAGYNDEGVTGYIYPNANCGGVPLYRLYNPQGVDHFYTTSAAERDSAARGGYNNEGITGYVLPYYS